MYILFLYVLNIDFIQFTVYLRRVFQQF